MVVSSERLRSYLSGEAGLFITILNPVARCTFNPDVIYKGAVALVNRVQRHNRRHGVIKVELRLPGQRRRSSCACRSPKRNSRYERLSSGSKACRAAAAWTEAEMQRAVDRYAEIFGEPPGVHAAAGWQTSAHALRMTQRLAFDYASDGRGTHPHLPVWRGELIRCPQFPTTLPTLPELLAQDGVSIDNVAAHLLERTAEPPAAGHVFTLRAGLEGRRLAPVLEQLVVGWRAQGYALVPLRALRDAVEPLALPRCEVAFGTLPGRDGTVLLQGREFLADVDLARAA